ncbi:MAG: GNAT family N-acetyltransferase [Eubacterium sp.]|jgi:Acetyltransferases, including N-acetylases of ribosomal proteins|nr:GNAT family N-acetyltransferase [Eubacterium sp.]
MSEYLRKAAKEDIDLLFQWANEAEVRANSFSAAQISYEEHTKWFQNMLHDRDRKQYIYMADDVPVGQIRIDISGDTAEVSYSVCDGCRGKGHGEKMLDLLQQKLLTDEPEVHRLIAKVKNGNQRSERAFLKLGYYKKCTVFEMKIKK